MLYFNITVDNKTIERKYKIYIFADNKDFTNWFNKNKKSKCFKILELTDENKKDTITSMGNKLHFYINDVLKELYNKNIYKVTEKDLTVGDLIHWYNLYTVTYYMTFKGKVYLMDVSGNLRAWDTNLFNSYSLEIKEYYSNRDKTKIPKPKEEELKRWNVPRWNIN